MNIINKFLNRYVYQDWNIAIADISTDFTPVNIRWMKHNYRDRWFADPFIIDENEKNYIILVEECLHSSKRGRLARLTVSKDDCRLLNNEPILDLDTHLSFPIPIVVNGEVFLYPENAAAGNTKYYHYSDVLQICGKLSDIPLADPVICKIDGSFYLLATKGDNCNGNVLNIYKSESPLGEYTELQDVVFEDNIARRAGKTFDSNGRIISPAQVCNNDYGEGVSLQEISLKDGTLDFKEIKRMYPLSKDYPEGFHTYNVFGNKVVIDGYRYGSKFLHRLYFKLRSII